MNKTILPSVKGRTVLVYKQFAVSIGQDAATNPCFNACLTSILIFVAEAKHQFLVKEAAVKHVNLGTCPG